MNAVIAFFRDVARSANQPCREHARTIDRALDARLSPGETFGLRLHLLYCRGCRRFRRQVTAIRAMSSQHGQSIRTGDAMPAEVRARLDASIRNAASADGGPTRGGEPPKKS
jgi:predicted Fe-S protein YdhL (DUF1289 family)